MGLSNGWCVQTPSGRLAIVLDVEGETATLRDCVTRERFQENAKQCLVCQPPEHGKMKLVDYERTVILNASHYKVAAPRCPTYSFENLSEAVGFANATPRSIIYAVTASGRSTPLTPEQATTYANAQTAL
jgi:hypothetical protein